MRKIVGLDEGLQILSDMLETFWDKLYPPKKRMRGRAGAIGWWLERIESELQGIERQPLPREQAERMRANFKRIDKILVEKMPDPPLLRPVQRIIEALAAEAEKAPAPAAAPETTAAAEQPVGLEARPQAEKPAARESAPAAANLADVAVREQDACREADAAFQRIRQASLFLLKHDLKNPSAYRYRRLAAWAKVESLPPNSDGVTQIPPPAPQIMEAILALCAEENWTALILDAEPRVSQYIFWFDLNYQVAEALKYLGADYRKALAAVSQETAFVLQRIPGVEKLTFNDETPFADRATRKWLQSLQGGPGGPDGGVALAGECGPDDRFVQVAQDARAMAHKKRLVDAVNLLQQEMQRSVGRSQQLRWRLAIAQLLLGAKKTNLALPHLEQILDDIDQFKLEAWQPSLALEGLTMAWKGFESQVLKEHKARAAELLNRIAKIDPAQALQLNR